MKKIVKFGFCIVLIYLFASPSFTSSIVFGNILEEDIKSCDDVKKLEFENWPSLFYCTNPISKDSDNIYFIFVSKPSSGISTELSVGGISSNFNIEQLNPNVYHWDSTKNKLVIDGDGTLIIHGDGNVLRLTSDEPKFRIYGYQNCEQLVLQIAMLNAQAYQITGEADDSTGKLLWANNGVLGILFAMFKTNEGFEIPGVFKELLTNMYQAKDAQGAAVALLENGQFKNLVDLGGRYEARTFNQVTLRTWIRGDDSIRIMADVDRGVYGTWDELIFVRFEPPSPGLADALSNNGYWRGYLVAPPVPDIVVAADTNNVLFNGENVIRIVVRSDGGELMYGFSSINVPLPAGSINRFLLLDPIPPTDVIRAPVSDVVGFDPRYAHTDGQFTWEYSKIDEYDNLVFTPSPATMIDDTVPLGIREQILGEITNLFAESKRTTTTVLFDADQAPEAEGALRSINDDLDTLDTVVYRSELGSNEKAIYSTMINNLRSVNRDLLTNHFSSNAFGIYETEMGRIEESITAEIYEIMGQATTKADYLYTVNGWWPEQSSINIADNYAYRYIEGKGKWGTWAEYNLDYRIGETIDDVPKEFSEPLHVAQTKYGAAIFTISLSFVFTLAPHLQKIAERRGDALLYASAVALKNIGIAYTIASISAPFLSIYEIFGISSLGVYSLTNFLSSLLTTAVFLALMKALIIAFLISNIVLLAICIYDPSYCYSGGCARDPAYNELYVGYPALAKGITILGKKGIGKYENLNYVYCGVKNCAIQGMGSSTAYLKLFYADKQYAADATFSRFIGDQENCESIDGMCFDCVVNVTDPQPGNYYTTGEFGWTDLIPVPQYYASPLTVCPSGSRFDESENKCGECDATSQTEMNGICILKPEYEYNIQEATKCYYKGKSGGKSNCENPPSYCVWTYCLGDSYYCRKTTYSECISNSNCYWGIKCEYVCGADLECDDKPTSYSRGYPDDINHINPPTCAVIDGGCDLAKECNDGYYCYESDLNCPTSLCCCVPYNWDDQVISANQIRGCNDCNSTVTYDSYIKQISVNDISSGDASVKLSQKIEVKVDVINTGPNQQESWFVGVEFYRVEDYFYVESFGPRDESSRVDVGFNGADKTTSCNPYVEGCECSYSEPEGPNKNGKLDPGETITVTCSIPASHFRITNDNQRIMFWVHERDLTQDANNNGIFGEWWFDALARSYRLGIDDPIDGGPASVRVYIDFCADIKIDGIVDIYDAILLARAFNSKIGDAKWNPKADLNEDGIVDIFDAILFANEFGKKASTICTLS